MSNHISRPQHSISGLFIFMLLGLFAVFSTVMVLLGARAYRNITANQAAHNVERIAPAYLRSMVRAADETDAFLIEQVGDSDALTITQVFDGEIFDTYIYCYQGVLRESFISSEIDFVPENGEEICAMDRMVIDIEDGLMHIRLYEKDRETEFSIALFAA